MKSIRVKLIAPFLIGLFVTALLLSSYAYVSAMRARRSAVLSIAQAKTAQVSSSMSLIFRSIVSTMQNITADPHVTAVFRGGSYSAKGKDTEEWIEILAQGNDYFRDIFITDRYGVCILSSNPSHTGKSFASLEPVGRALSGMFSIGDFSVGMITMKLSATAAGPIDVDGELMGSLGLIYDVPKIVSYEEPAEAKDRIFTLMLRPDGRFASHWDQSFMKNDSPKFLTLYDKLQATAREGEAVEYTLDGEQYIGFAQFEPMTKWVIISSAQKHEVFADARELTGMIFVISLLALLSISFIILRIANGIINSLLSLIDYAKRVSEGDIDSRLGDTDRADELGVLHRSLARLVETLQAMIRQTRDVSRMKGEFLANMSHEIRTPINAIIGMAHLSLRDKEIAPRQRDFLEKIQTAARSLLGVINDILDVSKIEAGKLVIEETPFEVRKLLEDTISIHQINARAKSLDIGLSCADDVPAWLLGDPLRIGQVLNNLLSNAVKFTQRGSVSLMCELEGMDGERARVAMTVTDTGIGIGAEALERLFQPFTQADASITRKFGGTGLGLAISLSLVELMGGRFGVASEPGKGSSFKLTLPLAAVDGAGAPAEADVPGEEDFKALRLEGKVILIAEDNMINRMILEELIAPAGATVLPVENGQMAADKADELEIDLIFMDMQMPVMDGLRATREIRARGHAMPIVAVTANAMNEDREEGFSAGMNAYITKPVELRQLYETLKLFLSEEGRRPG